MYCFLIILSIYIISEIFLIIGFIDFCILNLLLICKAPLNILYELWCYINLYYNNNNNNNSFKKILHTALLTSVGQGPRARPTVIFR